MRRRLHVNSLIADPGTFEWEWGGQVDFNGDWLIPTTWKFTPSAGDSFWGRTELSANFNAVQQYGIDGSDVTSGTDHIQVALTSALPGFAGMVWAVSPSANFLLRGDTGARLGGTLLGKLEKGRHQGGVQIGWTGATHSSSSNPAGTFDAGGGYGFRLGEGRWSGRWTVYGNANWERSTGVPQYGMFTEGVEFQATERFALDFNLQQVAGAGHVQKLLSIGVTWNLGKIR